MLDAKSFLKAYKDRFNYLKGERKTWDSMYQVLGEYISLMKQNFQNSPTSGEFLTNDIFDSTGTFSAHNAAAALLGMLWPGTAKQAIEIALEFGHPRQAKTSRLLVQKVLLDVRPFPFRCRRKVAGRLDRVGKLVADSR